MKKIFKDNPFEYLDWLKEKENMTDDEVKSFLLDQYPCTTFMYNCYKLYWYGTDLACNNCKIHFELSKKL